LTPGDESAHKISPVFGQILVLLVDSVGSVDEQQITCRGDGATRHIVLRDAEFAHHVEHPNHIGLFLGDDFFLFVGAIVLVVVKTFGVEATNLAAAGNEPQAFTFNERRGADALHGPVMDAAGGQLLAAVLPEKLAIFLVEGEQNA
jgi:hypothetical protein